MASAPASSHLIPDPLGLFATTCRHADHGGRTRYLSSHWFARQGLQSVSQHAGGGREPRAADRQAPGGHRRARPVRGRRVRRRWIEPRHKAPHAPHKREPGPPRARFRPAPCAGCASASAIATARGTSVSRVRPASRRHRPARSLASRSPRPPPLTTGAPHAPTTLYIGRHGASSCVNLAGAGRNVPRERAEHLNLPPPLPFARRGTGVTGITTDNPRSFVAATARR
jgi:hypothetical protein